MKKQRVSPVANFQINSDFGGGTLPQLEEVNRTVAELTGKTVAEPTPERVGEEVAPEPAPTAVEPEKAKTEAPKTEKKTKAAKETKEAKEKPAKITRASKPAPAAVRAEATPQYGRPLKEIAIGREKFTTMLQPDLVKSLKRQAIDEGITVADLLENILAEYYSK